MEFEEIDALSIKTENIIGAHYWDNDHAKKIKIEFKNNLDQKTMTNFHVVKHNDC